MPDVKASCYPRGQPRTVQYPRQVRTLTIPYLQVKDREAIPYNIQFIQSCSDQSGPCDSSLNE